MSSYRYALLGSDDNASSDDVPTSERLTAHYKRLVDKIPDKRTDEAAKTCVKLLLKQ
eukprot:CAMPEP_0172511452 /NCGR_PEP_ID=MMETSP1066-20121228/236486_1 /TAXON_ID=671091 /ORGANISM="Coscinodiscus wailesii, Strain CCMP2513" /LENGTH=56 /DNA_ID=CAMNT_0013290821 /DNA_START=24 /DNA_END=194 /DNA_ORIENTATION=+